MQTGQEGEANLRVGIRLAPWPTTGGLRQAEERRLAKAKFVFTVVEHGGLKGVLPGVLKLGMTLGPKLGRLGMMARRRRTDGFRRVQRGCETGRNRWLSLQPCSGFRRGQR